MSGFASFLLGMICGTWIPELIRKGRHARRPERVTNVFAVINLIYCAGEHHAKPLPASITYNVSFMHWEAGCAECDIVRYGATPHEAAKNWNEYAMKVSVR